MKVEYINPFIEAAQVVFKTLLDTDVQIGDVYLKPSPFIVSDMIIMLGIVGEIRGQICLELSNETAASIVSTMMGGMTDIDVEELRTSAISEFGNMLLGNACTIFSKSKITIDITPPSILTGDKIKLSNKIATIVIPLTIQNFGRLDINVTAAEML